MAIPSVPLPEEVIADATILCDYRHKLHIDDEDMEFYSERLEKYEELSDNLFQKYYDSAETQKEILYINDFKSKTMSLAVTKSEIDKNYQERKDHLGEIRERSVKEREAERDREIEKISSRGESIEKFFYRIVPTGFIYFGTNELIPKKGILSVVPAVISAASFLLLHLGLNKYGTSREEKISKRCKRKINDIEESHLTSKRTIEGNFDIRRRNKYAAVETKLMDKYENYFGIKIEETAADRIYEMTHFGRYVNAKDLIEDAIAETQKYINNE